MSLCLINGSGAFLKHCTCVALVMVIVMVSLVVALTPCDLLRIKQGELSDVKRGIEESNILMRAFDEMGKSKEYSYKEEETSQQMINFEANLKEYKVLDKTLQMQVDSLKLLCKKEPGLSQKQASNVLDTSLDSAKPSSNIRVVETPSLQSESELIPTVFENEDESKVFSDGEVSPTTERQNDIGLRIMDGAYTVGNGLKSCRMYNSTVTNLKSGKYWINDRNDRYIVYCDMKTLGGGWSLVSSRGSLYEPINTNNTVLPLSFKGESVNIRRWSALREISSALMVTDGKGRFSTALIAAIANTSRVKLCSGLTTDLSKRVIFHKENSGCDYVGKDYCLIGTNFPGGSTEVSNLCADIDVFGRQYGFKNNEILKELDVYIR